jgi:hypothetical protein
MAIYTVHAPPAGDRRAADPAAFAFVKEGFCWPALVIPALWLLYRRMWLVFLAYLVVTLALGRLGQDFGDGITGAILVFAWLLFAIEANGLRRWTLERNGWRLIGVAEGSRLADAEQRFYAGWVADGGKIPTLPAAPPPPPPRPPSAEAGHVVGLFPMPERGA